MKRLGKNIIKSKKKDISTLKNTTGTILPIQRLSGGMGRQAGLLLMVIELKAMFTSVIIIPSMIRTEVDMCTVIKTNGCFQEVFPLSW
jgi:hypothetical protein